MGVQHLCAAPQNAPKLGKECRSPVANFAQPARPPSKTRQLKQGFGGFRVQGLGFRVSGAGLYPNAFAADAFMTCFSAQDSGRDHGTDDGIDHGLDHRKDHFCWFIMSVIKS